MKVNFLAKQKKQFYFGLKKTCIKQGSYDTLSLQNHQQEISNCKKKAQKKITFLVQNFLKSSLVFTCRLKLFYNDIWDFEGGGSAPRQVHAP